MERADIPKILIVDDDPEFLDIYKLCLGEHFEVHLAEGGECAIRQLHKVKPAAILLDLRMPRVSGFAVLEHMQRQSALRELPVIVITSRRLDRKLREILDSQANVCHAFEKTVSPRRVAEEAKLMVEMGRLYSATRELISRGRGNGGSS
ncbi:PleD family two-component system response regulator [Elusimicrobiota bacterium]